MKKNVLFLAHSAQIGGAETCLLDLLSGLKKDGHGGLVLIPCDGPIKERLISIGWEVVTYPIPWWITFAGRNRWHLQDLLLGLPKRLTHICGLMKERKIDTVYTNTLACFDGALAARIAKMPHVWHIHEIFGAQREMEFYLPKWLVTLIIGHLSKCIIVPSRIARDSLTTSVMRTKARMVNNGVDLYKFAPRCAVQGHTHLGIPAGAQVVAIIGGINKNKRQADFVEAAGIVARQRDNVYFLVVGTGSSRYITSLEQRISELGLSKRFKLTGVLEDVAEILALADVLVSASLVECQPRILIEAMAMGKPVVATRSGGSEELVVHGETGLLVSTGNPPELAAAILTLLENDELAVEMGRRGRKRAEDLYSVERYVRDIEEILSAIS
jgi:glycosyltransferase involved in cell wall biosynthesis